MTFEVVNPLADPSWNRWVLEHGQASVFHSAEWTQVLMDCYGYRPVCGVLKDAGRVVGMLPLVEVASLLAGRHGVSLPFSDECAPLLCDGVSAEWLVDPMLEFGRQRGWKYLELRGGADARPSAVRSQEFTMHYLALGGSEEGQFKKLKSCQRRNIKKARREGVEIHRLQTREAVDTYYVLHCLTRGRQGLPPQPRRFFHAIHEHVIASGYGFVLMARFEGRWIAGGVFLHFGSRGVYKFGASDYTFQHVRANSLLMWEAIRRFRELGVTLLSLGRTDPLNSGLLQFKRGWGAEEVPLSYCRLGLRKGLRPTRMHSGAEASIAGRIMKRMPIPLLRFLGSCLYRHLG